MKAYQIQKFGNPEGLELVDQPVPEPAPDEVLVRIKAASLNYRDLVVLRGQYDKNPRQGLTPLSDGAGEVISVGEKVTQFRAGDRVAGCFFQSWVAGEITADVHKSALGGAMEGVLAEYRIFREQGLVPLPTGYSFEEGATLPCAALTVWQSLITRGRLAPGESVLLLGTGGVSIFGLQFAKAAGAKVIITSSSDEKLQRARAMGADEVINYKSNPEWGKTAAQLAGNGVEHGNGVDHVVEVGGAGTFAQSIQAAKFGGKIGLIGILSGRGAPSEIFPVVHKCLTVSGIYVGNQEMFLAMNRGIEQTKIKPVIDKVFPFDDAREAFAYMQGGAHFGKVVVRVG